MTVTNVWALNRDANQIIFIHEEMQQKQIYPRIMHMLLQLIEPSEDVNV